MVQVKFIFVTSVEQVQYKGKYGAVLQAAFVPLTSVRQQISSQLEQSSEGSTVTGRLNAWCKGTAGYDILNAY